MGWWTNLKKASRVVAKIPGLKTVARAVPVLGTAVAVAEGVSLASEFLPGRSKPKVPALPAPPSMTGAGLPVASTTTVPVPSPGFTSGPGILPRGPGGKLQLPWSDPSVPKFLKQFAIDDAYLRTAVRAPRGYVVLRDAEGRPFGVMKQVARQFKLWKPKQKPPISVRDWNALKRADKTVKKLKRVVKMSKAVSMPSRRRTVSASARAAA